MRVTCSNCGYVKVFKASDYQIIKRLKEGWNSVGSALYCPECVRTWDERNGKERPVWGIDHTSIEIEKIRNKNRGKVGCGYCISIEESTPASPRHRYNYCPMCGTKRKKKEV